MEQLMDKLSSYNILNNMLPGAVFCNLLNLLLNINVLKSSLIQELFMYYFVGMVIGRIGSVIVEPICKKSKLVTYAHYKEFLKASSKDKKLDILSETNNTYRTMLSMCLIICAIKLYLLISDKFIWIADYTSGIIIISLTTLFTFSYRKQTNYIRNRADYINEDLK